MECDLELVVADLQEVVVGLRFRDFHIQIIAAVLLIKNRVLQTIREQTATSPEQPRLVVLPTEIKALNRGIKVQLLHLEVIPAHIHQIEIAISYDPESALYQFHVLFLLGEVHVEKHVL